MLIKDILLTEIAAAQNEIALSYCIVRGLYFLAVVFATTVVKRAPYLKPAVTNNIVVVL